MVALALFLMLCAAPAGPAAGPRHIELGGKVERGESLTLRARGLVPGQRYRFLADGACRPVSRDHAPSRRPFDDPSVVGFSAQIGGAEYQLVAGPNTIDFTAPSRDVTIKVFDRGLPSSYRCSFSLFAIDAR